MLINQSQFRYFKQCSITLKSIFITSISLMVLEQLYQFHQSHQIISIKCHLISSFNFDCFSFELFKNFSLVEFLHFSSALFNLRSIFHFIFRFQARTICLKRGGPLLWFSLTVFRLLKYECLNERRRTISIFYLWQIFKNYSRLYKLKNLADCCQILLL